MPPPLNRSAILRPAMISDNPDFGMRPATNFTWGRNVREWAPIPRITTLDGEFVARLGSVIRTTSSLATSGWPFAPMAASGCVSIMDAWYRLTPLWTSELDPFRITMRLSYDPVSTSVFRSPSASIRMAAKTKTTRAIPDAVNTVVSRRVQRFRKLYEMGMPKNILRFPRAESSRWQNPNSRIRKTEIS